MCGDMSRYTGHSEHPLPQFKGIGAVPFTEATGDNGSNLFYLMRWDLAGLGVVSCRRFGRRPTELSTMNTSLHIHWSD